MNTDEYSAEYFRRREAHERELAEKAHSEEIRVIHLALAENYQAAAEEAEREGL
ncbi:MAG TPA: hypothetical protein VGD23_09840 [Sphingomicrobium sp.]